MPRTIATVAALLLVLTALPTMQERERPRQPDFSGVWILIAPANPSADVATTLSVRQPIATTTVRGTPMPPAYLELFVERHFPTDVRSEEYAIGIEGGTVSEVPAAVHVETRESVKFVGDSLVITTSHSSGAPGELRVQERHEEVWRSDSDGQLVMTIIEQQGKRESRRALTYRRR